MTKKLSHYFEEYIYECQFVGKRRPMTIAGYKIVFRTFIKLSPEESIESLTPARIIQFFKKLNERERIVGKGIIKIGVKNSTVGSYWCRLNAFCSWLEINGHIKGNPFKSLKYPRIQYEDTKYLQKNEIEKILAALHNPGYTSPMLFKRNLCIFYMLLYTGIRREELLMMQIRDLDMEKKTVTIRAETSKSGRMRILPLHSGLLLHLKDYLAYRRRIPCQFLFISMQTNDRLSYEGLKHLIIKLSNQTGVSFHLHQFRHTFAINFLRANSNIHTLRHLLGHRDIRITMQYLRFLPREELQGNVERLNIDSFL